MALQSSTKGALPGSILLVIHDFAARSPDELSLAKGDRIELIERDDEFGDGWFLGKHLTNGSNGLFPEVYTTPAPKGTLSNIHGPKIGGDAAGSALSRSSALASGVTPNYLPSQSITSSPPSAFKGTPPSTAYSVTSDSPVMSETLSVIDEHITDMRTPRSSYGNNTTTANKRDTIGSVYSMHPFARASYIAGHETDEEESQAHTEGEVMAWSPSQVAEYLEDIGVERAHCDVFKEQEISGEVLLAMDQNSLFIKEFDLGSVGRRLKTWHKIKALQEEAKRKSFHTRADSTGGTDVNLLGEEGTRARSSTTGTMPPRAHPTKPQNDGRLHYSSNVTAVPPMPLPAAAVQRYDSMSGPSPLQSITSVPLSSENTYRPSAQDIRNMNSFQRLSSVSSDATDSTAKTSSKKPTVADRRWPLGQSSQSNGKHAHTTSTSSTFDRNKAGSSLTLSPSEVDRGYFSSTEVESRHRSKNVLSKRSSNAISSVSSAHSRSGSYVTLGRSSVHSKTIDNADDGVREMASATSAPSTQPPSSGIGSVSSRFSAFRSAAVTPSKATGSTTALPTITKSEPLTEQLGSPDSAKDAFEGEKSSPAATVSPTSLSRSLFSSAKARVTGLRSISDAVTKDEKDKTISPTDRTTVPSVDVPVTSLPPTGTSTPSTENRSLDMSKSDVKSRGSTGSAGLLPPPSSARRARTKTKKTTSAYTRGLEKKSPAEQMLSCDYAGWMKKKSGSLMTTWKPRLFILRGRRLSYYYGEDDDEEKGLIDISFHRVLPAHNEMLTGLHATMMGAAGSPNSPTNHHTTPTIAQQDLRDHPAEPGADDSGLFIFKLVPPKTGLAKGVNFTKPTVHYFAVNSRQEGRLWMAALMKATIDRDHDAPVTTTYNQKTISLSKARARRERPPALKEEEDGGDGDGDDFDDEDEDEDEAEQRKRRQRASLGTFPTTATSPDAASGGDLATTDEKGLGIGGIADPAVAPSAVLGAAEPAVTSVGDAAVPGDAPVAVGASPSLDGAEGGVEVSGEKGTA